MLGGGVGGEGGCDGVMGSEGKLGGREGGREGRFAVQNGRIWSEVERCGGVEGERRKGGGM